MTDRQFLSRLRKSIALMKENAAQKWVAAYLAKAVPLADSLEAAIPVAEHAEAAWHKDAGSKLTVVDQAESGYRKWANHVKADIHGAELGEFIHDHNSVAGLEDALCKMLDAFNNRSGKGKSKDDPVAAYAAEAAKELQPLEDKLEELLVSTRETWQAFRDAAGEKNALKVKAWEVFKSVRRHLKVDLGHSAAVQELKNPPRHVKKPASQPQPAAPHP